MLLSQQPQGCLGSIPALHPQSMSQYNPAKLFNSLLSPAVTVSIGVNFTSDRSMAHWSTESFDKGSPPSQLSPERRPPRPNAGSQVDSPKLPTFRRADAALRAELKYASTRWEDDELDTHPTSRMQDSKVQLTYRQTRSPDDDVDVFEVQCRPGTIPDARQLDDADLANKPESLDLSPTNITPQNTLLSPQDPRSHSTDTKAVDFRTHRIRSPIQSPQRDPRTLFGSRETHLPWVKKLSSGRFTMTVSPDMLSRDAPPPKSIWDADDDEFDRWPTANEAREELNTMRINATTKRSTFIRPAALELSVREQIAEAVITPMGDVTRTPDEQQQSILELEDMDCGDPQGRDLHDTILTPFRSRDYPILPHHAPARHMHVLDAKAYTAATDPVVKAARPRLCDAVATVLAYTSPECIAAFLDPEVEVFEWRRLINCVMIRREGRNVVVGNYYNFGTAYRWGYLVRSTIDGDGAWRETWAGVSQGTTPVGKDGVLYEQFEADGTDWNVEPHDEEFALYVGRQLANFLLGYEVWNYYKWWRYRVEWEADGKVTDAREKNRYPTGLTFD